jgi:hypothetical protein
MGAEFYLVAGIFLISVSSAALAAAQSIRGWFFEPDLRAEVVRLLRQAD